MDERIPVYLKFEHLVMLYEKMANEFQAEGYNGASVLIAICDAFKEAIERHQTSLPEDA